MPSSRSSNRSEPTRRAALATLGGLSLSVLACSTPKSKPHGDRQEALRETVAKVMLPTFVELAEKTAILATATKSIDAASLPEVRRKFRDARAVWNRSEAFLLGPSDDLALTGGAIDSWPVGIEALDALITGTGPVETAPANVRGLPGIEQLLFDADATLEQARRREVVASQAAELATKCAAIRDAWSAKDGYGYQLAEGGKGSTLFSTQKDAVDKIITAMVALAERMVVAKLAKPLGLDTGGPIRPDLEEAPKSDGSLDALEHNLRGLRAVYDGGDDSFSRAVAALSSNADTSFRNAIDAALAAIVAVGEPMRVALAGDREKLLALHATVQAVKRSLVTDVASTLGASIGFGYSDTD